MVDRVRIVEHSAVPHTGSFEVIHPGGREFFYWDDIAGRRLRPDAMTRDQALQKAKAFARAERNKLN